MHLKSLISVLDDLNFSDCFNPSNLSLSSLCIKSNLLAEYKLIDVTAGNNLFMSSKT